MSNVRRIFGAVLILALISVTLWLPTGPFQTANQAGVRSAAGVAGLAPAQQEPTGDLLASEPVEPQLTGRLDALPPASTEITLDREVNPRMNFGAELAVDYNPDLGPDPLLAVQEAAAAPDAPDGFETLLLNYNGQGFSSVNPPDTVGEIGPNHYVQMINGGSGTRVTIYNKNSGAVITGPIILDSLATSGACQTGLGDPIVLYDQQADRWLLSEFAGSGNHLCVYISTSANPTGSYYAYDFTTPNFPDYPKYAVWRDAYYVSTNESGGPAVYALDRTRMLSGLSATFQRRTAPALSGFGFQALTPADLDGVTLPPSGAPGLFMRHRDTEVHGPAGQPSNDLLEVWAFTVNWSTPASSTFSKIADIQVAEFDSALCGLSSFACIPQPGTSTRLDPLREVIMWRLGYRNFGSRQVLVGNFSTDVGSDRAGVRWFELRKTGANWTLFQEGTYAPGNVSRWMGGIAMDKSGNMALGYNVGSSSTYPSLRYVGRLASDGAGTMPRGEYTIVNGSAANASNRYGDYSSMNVDPVDDCTFWFTGQWNDASQWKTRIAKMKFDQCGQVQPPPGAAKAYLPIILRWPALPTGTVAGWVRRASNSQPISGAQVCVLSSNQCATTNAQGTYSIPNVAAGNQTVRATASGYTAVQQAVTVNAGGTATANFSLASSSVPHTLTQSQSQAIVAENSVACIDSWGSYADNAYLRAFRLTDYGISGAFAVNQVQFGVEYAEAGSGGSQPVRVRLYRKTNPAGPLTYGNLTTIATANINLPNKEGALHTTPIVGTAPAGSVLVVEVFTPNGQNVGHIFFIGSNPHGQSASSYLAAADCGLPEPVTTGSIGYPDMHIVMNVTGTSGAAAPEAGLDAGAAEPPVTITLSTETPSGEFQLRRRGE
jgi:hypothetical protein